MGFTAAFSVLGCEAHLAVIISTCFATNLCGLVCGTLRVSKVASWIGTVARALALDTISVGNFPVYILLIPSLGSNIRMLKFVVVIVEDVLQRKRGGI